MNEANIRRIIAAIRAEPDHFEMNNWFKGGYLRDVAARQCGTAACIGGWAEVLMHEDLGTVGPSTSPDYCAWLGWDRDSELDCAFDEICTMNNEFIGDDPVEKYEYLSMAHFDKLPATVRAAAAAEVLERFIATGKNHWAQVLHDQELIPYVTFRFVDGDETKPQDYPA